MYILGINESHLATAALLKDGEIIACASEERFTRKKNQGGFPKLAMEFCLKYAGINIDTVDLIVFGYKDITGSMIYHNKERGVKSVLFISRLKELVNNNLYYLCRFLPVLYTFYKFIKFLIHEIFFRYIKYYYVHNLESELGINKKKVMFLQHQLSHAYAAYFINGKRSNKDLVITNDGSGDNSSGKVYVVKDNFFKEISSTPNDFSVAYFYYYITKFLGFRPDEEEYKVMGLAPYADSHYVKKIYSIFRNIFYFRDLNIRSTIPREAYFGYISAKLSSIRFDVIAAAVQKLTEELFVLQVEKSISKTKISNVFLGGGLAMNIKANMKISQIGSLTSLNVCPSSGDESTSIGCCFYGYQFLNKKKSIIKQMSSLYLGPAFNESEIQLNLNKLKKKYKITRLSNVNKSVAKLLASGNIVARFAGRMEFGARALGNRSILADPRKINVIRVINSQIKSRDFWMPFAPTILSEYSDAYLNNPKKIDSPFMMIGFKTTDQAKKEIPATLHPADNTCRPQILKREQNPDYYDLINEFKKITGVGALLNTSFNLHGEPIVCTPEDAIRTFDNSGLEYLLLENYLIQKQ